MFDMGRRAKDLLPPTALGAALFARRNGQKQRAVAAELGVTDTTLSELERGQRMPSGETALKLARWLGWTAEQVIEGARTTAGTPE